MCLKIEVYKLSGKIACKLIPNQSLASNVRANVNVKLDILILKSYMNWAVSMKWILLPFVSWSFLFCFFFLFSSLSFLMFEIQIMIWLLFLVFWFTSRSRNQSEACNMNITVNMSLILICVKFYGKILYTKNTYGWHVMRVAIL